MGDLKNGNEEVSSYDWKGFHFRLLTDSDHSKVMEQLRSHFIHEESTHKLQGPNDVEERLAQWSIRLKTYLEHGLSVVAIDKATQQVAGTCISCISYKSDDLNANNPPLKPGYVNNVRKFANQLDQKLNVFEHYGVDKLVDLHSVSVGKTFRGQGLATELFRFSIQVAKARGFALMKSIFSSPYTRRIGDALGFKELDTLKFIDGVNPNGEPIFPHATEADGYVTLSCLEL